MQIFQFQQFDLKSDQDQGISTSHKIFEPKFFKELNFQQNSSKWRERRIKQRKKMVDIKKLIYQQCMSQFVKQNKNQNKQTQRQVQQICYSGNIIKGKFKKKCLHGNAEIKYKNGVQFRGFYKNGQMRTGKFDFKNGYQYWGQLEGKKFMGKGTLKYPDGTRITGIWNNYEIIGKGQIQYPSGDIYYGQTKNFKKDGQGYLFFKNGNKFIGNFRQGQMDGYGTYFGQNGNIIKGIWKNNQYIQTQQQQEQQFDEKEDQFQSILNPIQLIKFQLQSLIKQ